MFPDHCPSTHVPGYCLSCDLRALFGGTGWQISAKLSWKSSQTSQSTPCLGQKISLDSILFTWLMEIKTRTFSLSLPLFFFPSYVFPLLMSAENTFSHKCLNSVDFKRDGFCSSPTISTLGSPSCNISICFVGYGKNKAVERDVSILEFTSLVAQCWPVATSGALA